MSQATINIQIDEEMKQQAEELFFVIFQWNVFLK
jgi:antitoxin component of RelBE/YafQ-DinJ toxin-antitoxin module